MAIRKQWTETQTSSLYEKPIYSTGSKMNAYSTFFDPKLGNKPNVGFMRNVSFTDEQKSRMQTFIVTTEYEHRIDLISYKFFRTTMNDWLIETVNQIKDPIKEIVAGKMLYIPDELDIISLVQ